MTAGETHDAIVVGSGITGGWAAKELTENGLKTLLLERGRPVEHGKDYVGEHMSDWQLPYRGWGDRRLYEKEYPVQSQCYAFGEDTRHFFVNDSRHPYSHDEDKPFSWIRGYHLGGRSLMWARQCYRWSDLDFEANARDGFGVDWPIRYADIAPWYDYVERFAGISGQAEGLPQLPDGKFLPPMEMNCVEQVAKEKIARAFAGRVMTIGRSAVLTAAAPRARGLPLLRPLPSRAAPRPRTSRSLGSTLPAAVATGNLTVRTAQHRAQRHLRRGEGPGGGCTRHRCARPGNRCEFYARVIFLCASTLGSTQILLNSTSSRFPNGLANSSGALGHYLMDHTFRPAPSARCRGFEDRYYRGIAPTASTFPRFRNVDERAPRLPARLRLPGRGLAGGLGPRGQGAGLRRRAASMPCGNPGRGGCGFGGFGEMSARYENHVELDAENPDAWGIPQLRIHCTWSDNENRLRQDIQQTAMEMLEAAGAARHRRLRPRCAAGPRHPRDGDRAHGTRPEDRRCSTAGTRPTTCPISSSPTAPA